MCAGKVSPLWNLRSFCARGPPSFGSPPCERFIFYVMLFELSTTDVLAPGFPGAT